jgi:hypothetical protein
MLEVKVRFYGRGSLGTFQALQQQEWLPILF